jgi:hypothetical protein
VSNLNGTVTVTGYDPGEFGYHLRAVTPEAKRRSLQAAGLIFEHKVASPAGMCALTVTEALKAAGLPISGGNANQMDELLQTQGYELVKDGVYQPGDIVGWQHYGRPGSRGWKFGHIGIITNAGRGRPAGGAPERDNSQSTSRIQQLRAQVGHVLGFEPEDLDVQSENWSFERGSPRRMAMEQRVAEVEGEFAAFLKSLMPEEMDSIIDRLYR